MGKTIHMSISVRGVLQWPKSQLKGMFRHENGKLLTPDEAREYLMDQLADGYECIPFGTECDNFDKKEGCLGHAVKD